MSSPAIIFGAIGCSLACVTLGLVCAWAQYVPHAEVERGAVSGYLGVPNWRNNTFAWHPVLMVAGFFFTQVFSYASIIFLETKTRAFISYFICQLGAICTLIAGLRAIVKYKYDTSLAIRPQDNPGVNGTEYSLITLHSWIGVLVVIAFVVSNLMGTIIGVVGLTGKAVTGSWTFSHMFLSMITFGLTFVCIISGVTVYHGEFGCDYVGPTSTTITHINPGGMYHRLPYACRFSNGVGLAAMFAAIFIALGLLASRNLSLTEEPADTNEGEEADEKEPADAEQVEMTVPQQAV